MEKRNLTQRCKIEIVIYLTVIHHQIQMKKKKWVTDTVVDHLQRWDRTRVGCLSGWCTDLVLIPLQVRRRKISSFQVPRLQRIQPAFSLVSDSSMALISIKSEAHWTFATTDSKSSRLVKQQVQAAVSSSSAMTAGLLWKQCLREN